MIGEVVGIAPVLPFVAHLVDPEVVADVAAVVLTPAEPPPEAASSIGPEPSWHCPSGGAGQWPADTAGVGTTATTRDFSSAGVGGRPQDAGEAPRR